MRLAEAARPRRVRLIIMAAVLAIAASLATTAAWMITSFRSASTT
jgi:hypothetical protein